MIDCPVCQTKNISENKCPQCDADVAPLVHLMHLPGKYHEEGVDLLKADRTDEAIEELITALSFDPKNVGIHLTLGEAYFKKGMYIEALDILERALKIAPDNQNIKSTVNEIQARRDSEIRAAQKEKRKLGILRGLAIGIPIITFILGMAIIPFINSLAPEPSIDFPALTKEIYDTISQFPELRDLNVRASHTGRKILLSGEVPSILHRDFVAYLAGNVASDGLLDSSDLVIRVPERRSTEIEIIRYRVRRGESLSLIALSFYGDKNKWKDIYALNQEILPSPGVLMPGQVIKIPLQRE